jgi:hypothetical protein
LDVTGTLRTTGEARFDNAINLKTATLNQIYFDDAVAFTRNGTGERMRIDSSGNVGIGTTSPAKKLELYSSQNANVELLRLNNPDSNGLGTQIGFTQGSTTWSQIISEFSSGWRTKIGAGNPSGTTGGDAGYFTFFTNNGSSSYAERMRITATGDVGIGTSSPAALLDINGSSGWAGVTTGNVANIKGANATVTQGGNLRVLASTAFGADIGGSIALGGQYTSGFYYDFAQIAGRKENATDNNTSGYLAFATRANGGNTTERARIDSSGNLGLGVTPSAWASGNYALQVGTGAGNVARFASSTTSLSLSSNGFVNSAGDWKYLNTGYAATNYSQAAGVHAWFNAASGTAGNTITFTQAMTLDASGNLLVGKTSNDTTVQGVAIVNGFSSFVQTSGAALLLNRLGTDGAVLLFRKTNIDVGSVSLTGSATAYNTSSDYRLKNTIAPMTGALAKVGLLKPVTYKWNLDNSESQGFIAHELQSVVPECVTGEKDAVETYTDEDGNEATRPVYQGIDTSFLVATLTAAIQEQQALITAMTTRITALEST